jgi:hypothetical protein
MPDSDLLPSSPARLVLDFGVDEQTCESGLLLDERGMRFVSRWEFSLGTQLAVLCDSRRAGHSRMPLPIEGIVVWCERLAGTGAPAFDVTVLFLDLPDDLRQSVRDFSLHLTEAA